MDAARPPRRRAHCPPRTPPPPPPARAHRPPLMPPPPPWACRHWRRPAGQEGHAPLRQVAQVRAHPAAAARAEPAPQGGQAAGAAARAWAASRACRQCRPAWAGMQRAATCVQAWRRCARVARRCYGRLPGALEQRAVAADGCSSWAACCGRCGSSTTRPGSTAGAAFPGCAAVGQLWSVAHVAWVSGGAASQPGGGGGQPGVSPHLASRRAAGGHPRALQHCWTQASSTVGQLTGVRRGPGSHSGSRALLRRCRRQHGQPAAAPRRHLWPPHRQALLPLLLSPPRCGGCCLTRAAAPRCRPLAFPPAGAPRAEPLHPHPGQEHG